MGFTTEYQQPVRDFLKSVKYEAMKIYRVFDAQNRVSVQYECPTNTKDGGGCLRTDYVYDGTSNRIIKLKESAVAWSAAWDV